MARILVVDDTTADRQLLKSLLEPNDHEVLEASDGAEALALLKKESVDLIIADVLMPTMDGYEFVSRVRAMPEMSDVRLMFWSAVYHAREARQMVEACGVSAHVTKPVEPNQLLDLIEKILASDVPASKSTQELDRSHLDTVNRKLIDKISELEHSNQRLQRFVELGTELASERDPERLLQAFCHAVRNLTAARYAAVGVVQEDDQSLRYFYTSGIEAKQAAKLRPEAPRQGLLGEVLKSRTTLRLDEASAVIDELGIQLEGPSTVSLVCAPVTSLHREYGWLLLINKIGAAEFSEEDETLARIFSGQVGRIFENGSLYAELAAHTTVLEKEVNERRRVERERDKVLYDLRERVKELTLLHNAAEILQREANAAEVLSKIVRAIPSAWQYPEITAARIVWDGKEFKSDNFAPTPWMQRVETTTPSGRQGIIEVCYLREAPADAEGPFLAEERKLIELLAEMLFSHLERRETLAKMQKDEAFLRTLVASAPVCIKLVDRAGVIRQINPAGLAMLEAHSEDQVVGHPVEEFLPPEARDRFQEFHEAICAGKSQRLEYVVIGLRGTRRNIEMFSAPLPNPADGEPAQLSLSRDLTKRKQVELELVQSEHRYRALVEASAQIIWQTNAVGLVENRIPSWEDFTGLAFEEIRGRGWMRSLHPDDVEQIGQRWQAAVEARAIYEVEYRVRRRDGVYRWFHVRGAPVNDEAGNVIEWIGACVDITEHKERELTIRRLAQIVESTTDAVIGVDLAGRITTWNSGATNILGYQAEEMLGRSVRELVPPERVDEMEGFLDWVAQGKRFDQVETVQVRKDKRVIHVSASMAPIQNEMGRVEGGSLIVRDISDHKLLEVQLRQATKMEAIGRLAGGVAHDFNNMLTVINGYSDVVIAGMPAGDTHRGMIEEVRRAGERSAGLTRQLLAFSRKQVLEPVLLDLNEVVRELAKMLQRLIGEDIDLVHVLDPDADMIRADPAQIENVIINLAVNARDAMPTGGRLTIETRNTELDPVYAETHVEVTPGKYVLLAVSDNGSGMDAETREHIFEPFFTTKEVGKGTGLGLASVFGVIKQSDGHIEVYSEPGRGTTFKIYLPSVESRVKAAGKSVEFAMPPGQETVLLAEDEEGVRGLIKFTLEALGFTVLAASNGDAAIALARQHTGALHLLLTDVVMPNMSGTELHMRLKEFFPQLKVLFMSGYTDEAVIRHGVLQSGQAFMQKPFTPQGLAMKVRNVLDKK